MRIHVLTLNGVFDTGLTAVLDAFGTANVLAEMTGTSSLRFQVRMVGLRKTITTARGLSVPVTAAARAQTPDAVVTPAINQLMPEPLVRALADSEMLEAGAVLRKWSARGALTAAACVAGPPGVWWEWHRTCRTEPNIRPLQAWRCRGRRADDAPAAP